MTNQAQTPPAPPPTLSDRAMAVARIAAVALALGLGFAWLGVYGTGDQPFLWRLTYWTGLMAVGIIASVTAAFCAACDRARLTADGQVRNCLFSRTETDLRTPMRDGASDDELLDLMRGEMWRKRRGHGIGDPGFVQPDRPMSAIGG